MTSLPSGTVAFLLSDIEGSTRLIGRLGDSYPRLLGEHDAALRDAVVANAGTIVSQEGDSVFAVFPSIRQALGAAVAGQRALAAHAWPAGVEVRVRMGLHVGEAVMGGRDYTGIDVHRAARIMGAGHGGQILLSDAARGLLGEKAGDASFLDLGLHGLRDLPAAERLFQVVAPGLDTEFPPLRTQRASAPTNLPNPLTRFVGRLREIGEVRELLTTERLVTLTGPGGTGKTRLAIEAARGLDERYPDGIWFVALDVVREPALVLAAVAATLKLREQPGTPIGSTIAAHLADQRVLLVLDNLEQVVDCAPDVAALLQAAPILTILVSSREPLAISGERNYPVPPLSLPAEPGLLGAAQIQGHEAVILFVERARAARPDFVLTDANARAVAAICRRLDGLPLALELAASRMNVLSPDQILARLEHRLTLLASSRRDLPERQRTLRGAIDWSHDLLNPTERAFFRGMSAFAGGADLEAVETVLNGNGELGGDVLDLSAGMVDRSLIRARAVNLENRLEMLETIREYAAEQLAEAGEDARVRACHAAYYRDLAEASAHVLTDPDRDAKLDRLDRELANFQAAAAWCLASDDHQTGLRMATALRNFLHTRGHLLEGRRLLEPLLAAAADDEPSALRARAVGALSELTAWGGDFMTALKLAEEGLAMARVLGDPLLMADALQAIGWSTISSRPDYARDHFQEAIEVARGTGDKQFLMGALQGRSLAFLQLGAFDAARESIGEAIDLGRASGDHYMTSINLVTLGFLEIRQGRETAARERIVEALHLAHDAGAAIGTSLALDSLASIAVGRGDLVRGAMLAGAADRLRLESGGGALISISGVEEPLVQARRLMPADEFERAVAAGRALTTDDAVALALQADAVAPSTVNEP